MKQNPRLDFKDNYYSFQEGAKRLNAAMKGIPDRVPVYAQMHEFTMHELGIPAKNFYTTPEILTPATLEIAERYGIDVGFVDYDVYNIEAEAFGQKVVFLENHIPDVDRSTPLISGPKDLHIIKTPDFDSTGRLANHVGGIGQVQLSPDETLLLSGSLTGTNSLWRVEIGEEIRRYGGGFVVSSHFSRMGVTQWSGTTTERWSCGALTRS